MHWITCVWHRERENRSLKCERIISYSKERETGSRECSQRATSVALPTVARQWRRNAWSWSRCFRKPSLPPPLIDLMRCGVQYCLICKTLRNAECSIKRPNGSGVVLYVYTVAIVLSLCSSDFRDAIEIIRHLSHAIYCASTKAPRDRRLTGINRGVVVNLI